MIDQTQDDDRRPVTAEIIDFTPRDPRELRFHRKPSARAAGQNAELHETVDALCTAGYAQLVQTTLTKWRDCLLRKTSEDSTSGRQVKSEPENRVEEEDVIPKNRRVLLPARSAIITGLVLKEQLEHFSRREWGWKRIRLGEFKIEMKWDPSYGEHGEIPDFLITHDSRGIRRVYVSQDSNWLSKIRKASLFEIQCEKCAAANVKRLQLQTVPAIHIPDYVAEIEHQLDFVSREQEIKGHPGRLPVRSVFLRFEQWKQSHQCRA